MKRAKERTKWVKGDRVRVRVPPRDWFDDENNEYSWIENNREMVTEVMARVAPAGVIASFHDWNDRSVAIVQFDEDIPFTTDELRHNGLPFYAEHLEDEYPPVSEEDMAYVLESLTHPM